MAFRLTSDQISRALRRVIDPCLLTPFDLLYSGAGGRAVCVFTWVAVLARRSVFLGSCFSLYWPIFAEYFA